MTYIKKSTSTLFFKILRLTSLCLSFVLGLFFTYSSSEGRMYGPIIAKYQIQGSTIYASDSLHRGITYEVPPEVREVVLENLNGQGMLYGFDEGEFKLRLGFNHFTRLKDIQAGEPIPLYNIESDKVISKNASVSTIAKPTTIWYVPLLVKNVCVSVLEINNIDGKWRESSLGGHEGFAINLENIRAAWPNDTFVLINIPRLNRMCFHIPRVGDYNLTPLYKKEPFFTLNKNEDTLYTSLTNMKIAVKKVNEVIIYRHKSKDKKQQENEIN